MNPATHEPRGTHAGRPALTILVPGLALLAIFAWNVHHYWFLGDDAFISFRYAQNWVEGHGLVWNAGEYVEGYTNFLWVIIMAAGMALGLEPEVLSCVLGVLCGGAVLIALGRFSLGRKPASLLVPWLPLFALALSRSFTAWSTGGLATQLFTLLILAAQLRFIAESERTDLSVRFSSLLFAFATLTRPEGGLFTAVAGLLFLGEVIAKKRSRAALLAWVTPWFAIVGGHFLWRFFYYGAWLPNTFHAKVNGFWPEQGLLYFQTFNDDYRIVLFLPLAFLALFARRDLACRLFAASALAYGSYLFAIGGGRFEFRFLVVLLPSLYWMIAEGLAVANEYGLAREAPRALRVGLVAAVASTLLVTTHLGSVRPEARRSRHDIESIQRTRLYADERIREGRTLARYIEQGVLPRDLMFSAGGAGALPYYTRWPTLDFRGLNDPRIAHGELETRGVIAHEHHASPEYMRERGVVVYDSLNQLLFHEDPTRFEGQSALRAGISWKLRAVRLPEHTIVFTTMVPEDEFRRVFEGLEILY